MKGLVPFGRNRHIGNGMGFHNMLDDFFGDMWSSKSLFDTFKMDVSESEKEYSVEAELPGVNKEDIRLEMNEGRLTIGIVQNEENQEDTKQYIHRERRTSSVARSVYLPDAAQEGVSAKLQEGILKIAVPKAAQTSNKRRIDIQ
ncbi:MAG: Hsp20/alpha crystallin family protein [Christensenellales bacterium]|jgi:HSP20 family protein